MSFLKILGPGLLYAAAAIGVSHLVQSTRAGAQFGHSLLWVVLLANLVKYPFFKIGPLYTSITGKSLLEAYAGISKWAIYLFILMTLATMFTVQAAVTIVTAGLAKQLFVTHLSASEMSVLLLLACSAILALGRYNILDNIVKVIVLVLTLTTLASLAMAFKVPPHTIALPESFTLSNKEHVFFLLALIGWMPAPMDVPIWHSMWAIANNNHSKKKTSVKEALLDFNIGFIGTAILAACFLSLGALVMHGSGETFSTGAASFAAQLINMYTKTLGTWSYWIIALAAFTTMFSTTITCLDAFPRILREGIYVAKKDAKYQTQIHYNFWLGTTALGACLILIFLMKNMKEMVDLATTLSFLVGPFYAFLSYLIFQGPEIPKKYAPKLWEKILMYFGLVSMTLLAFYYLYIRF